LRPARYLIGRQLPRSRQSGKEAEAQQRQPWRRRRQDSGPGRLV